MKSWKKTTVKLAVVKLVSQTPGQEKLRSFLPPRSAPASAALPAPEEVSEELWDCGNKSQRGSRAGGEMKQV